jgi:DAK2 domain fusion protein YloV
MEPGVEDQTQAGIRFEIENDPIDGQVLKRLTEAGLNWLRTNQQVVNVLNVFPVPDGDTGINMVLTMQSAFDEVANSPERNAGKMAHSIAQGALMGARGNSGVILSQLWRGLARALHKQALIDGPSLVRALESASETAYKGVVRPVEGTILTVAKDIAIAANEILHETNDPYEIIARIIPAADQSVKRTPELLSVLKEAGVVDAGGKGLFFIFEGMMRYCQNLPLDTPTTSLQSLAAMKLENTFESIEPGQDYEVIVDFHPHESLDLVNFYTDLEHIGTSIQVGEGDGLYRMHIHVPTEKRYEPIDYILTIGTITKVSLENLIAQMEDIKKSNDARLILSPIEPGQIAVIAVVPGAGIGRVFASLGVAAIVEGGQTMNPSTKEILEAFENLPTDKIIILPNNKNIILAAESAAQITVKNVKVLPSVSIPQGLSAMLRLIPQGDLDKVVDDMRAAMDEVETGEITVATRSVELNGVLVEEGQFIALLNGELITSASSLKEACINLLKKAHADHFELITLYYGIDTQRNEVYEIVDEIRKSFPDQEIDIQEGGQPHYHFIISIE